MRTREERVSDEDGMGFRDAECGYHNGYNRLVCCGDGMEWNGCELECGEIVRRTAVIGVWMNTVWEKWI